MQRIVLVTAPPRDRQFQSYQRLGLGRAEVVDGTDAAEEGDPVNPQRDAMTVSSDRKIVRKVLLAVRAGCVDARLLASARGLCQRMDAELEILLRAPGEAPPPEIEDFIRGLRAEGVAYSLSQKPVLRRRDIVHYANTHECVSTVVIDSLEDWESVAEDRASDPWAKLACPLVTAAPPKK